MLIRSTKMKYYLSGVKHTDDGVGVLSELLGFWQVMSVEVPILLPDLAIIIRFGYILYKPSCGCCKVSSSHFRPVMVDVYVLDPELYKSPKRIFEESSFWAKAESAFHGVLYGKLFYYKGDDLR